MQTQPINNTVQYINTLDDALGQLDALYERIRRLSSDNREKIDRYDAKTIKEIQKEIRILSKDIEINGLELPGDLKAIDAISNIEQRIGRIEQNADKNQTMIDKASKRLNALTQRMNELQLSNGGKMDKYDTGKMRKIYKMIEGAKESIPYMIGKIQPGSTEYAEAISLNAIMNDIEGQIGSMEKNMAVKAKPPRQFIAGYIIAALDVFVKSMALVLSKIKEILSELIRPSIERF